MANVAYFFVKGRKNVKGTDAHHHQEKDEGFGFIVFSVFHEALYESLFYGSVVVYYTNKGQINSILAFNTKKNC